MGRLVRSLFWGCGISVGYIPPWQDLGRGRPVQGRGYYAEGRGVSDSGENCSTRSRLVYMSQ